MESPKVIYFDNHKFTRDNKTGYYLCNTIRKRLHRYVWEFYNGKIPKGYEIHHIDGNKANNDISNLQMLSKSEHRKVHADNLTDEQIQWKRDNFNKNARPKAIEWHKSEEGRKWHKEHYEKYKETFSKVKIDLVCIYCGKEFVGTSDTKFCSNACKSAYRRKSGVDNITKICPICNKEFVSNKYKCVTTCSRSCANKYRWRIKHESEISKENK